MHVREPKLVRSWLFAIALSLVSSELPLAVQLFTSVIAGVMLFFLPIMTFRRVRGGTWRLRYAWPYRIVLGGLALGAAAAMVIAANTFIEGTHTVGPIGTAGAMLLIAIVAWRAVVRPSPRASALACLVTLLAATAGSFVDTMVSLQRVFTPHHVIVHHTLGRLIAQMAVGLFATLAGIAALSAFEPANDQLPEARAS